MSHKISVMSADPRFTRSREAIRRAVVEIIRSEGPDAVTHQHVADRAGVGRATVYRHWPNPFDLLFEAMQEVELPFLEPAEAPLRERLRADLRRIRDDLAGPTLPRMIANIIDRAQHEQQYRSHTERIVNAAVANMRTAVDRALMLGELHRTPDADLLVSQLLGPVVFRRLVADRPVTDDFIDQIVDGALAPWTDPTP